MSGQIEFARIGQFAAWHTLEEINHGLEGAQLDLSRGSREVRLQDGNLIPLQDLVNQVFALRPRNYSSGLEGDTYEPVVIKLSQFIHDEASQSCFAVMKQCCSSFWETFGYTDKEGTICRDAFSIISQDAFSVIEAKISGRARADRAMGPREIDPNLMIRL